MKSEIRNRRKKRRRRRKRKQKIRTRKMIKTDINRFI